MVYILLIVTLLLCLAVVAFLLIVQWLYVRKSHEFAPKSPNNYAAHSSAAETISRPPIDAKPALPGQSVSTPLPDKRSEHSVKGYGNSAQRRFAPPTSQPPRSMVSDPNAHASRSFEELIQEYEHGMQTSFDDRLGAILFVTRHVVMRTPQEVTLAFQVCTKQIYEVLKPRKLTRAALLTDIAGLVIGRDATAFWGQALKNCLEDICIKVGQDTYLVAHYDSGKSRPNEEQLQEKVRLIQFMTAAAVNNFQSNIFDTREEAVAFLQRMRELYKVP